MSSFRGTKQAVYCTPLDVRLQMSVLERNIVDPDDGETRAVFQTIADQTIEVHINQADSLIYGYLVGVYPESMFSDQDPYFLGPVTVSENKSTIRLRGVILAATAITEQWLIKFTSATAYDVVAQISGAQGSGSTAADFTSTNSDIQIKAEDWDLPGAGASIGDEVYFGTYIVRRQLRVISAQLAASTLINSLYTNSESDEAGWARSLRKQAMDLLAKLVDPKSQVSLTSLPDAEDDDPYEAVEYSVDRHGRDVTVYGDYPDDSNPMDI